MNKFFKILFSIFFVLLFETSFSYSEETKIKIGVLAPLSGEDASSPDSGASTPILILISSEYEMDVSNNKTKNIEKRTLKNLFI